VALTTGPPGVAIEIGPVVVPPATTKVSFAADFTVTGWTTPLICTEAPRSPCR
jgi:hypothetical protein